jgi:hypothetical protein
MKINYQDIDILLRDVNVSRVEQERKNNNIDIYNIFKILYKKTNEVKLHSRFLASLLNPNGSHRKGYSFLKLFLENQNLNLGDLENLEVYPHEEVKTEYKNIDILIINRIERKALIIENKIGSGDNNKKTCGQLEGYFEKIRDEDKISTDNLHSIYLTLDGREPSNESLGKYSLDEINGECISYEVEIQNWLIECLKIVIKQPGLNEIIIQYKKLIAEMTHQEEDIQFRLNLRKAITRNENNLKSAKVLFENYKHIKWHTIFDFWVELEKKLEAKGYKISKKPSIEATTYLAHYESYKTNWSKKQAAGLYFRVKKNFEICIGHEEGEYLYFGSNHNSVKDVEIIDKITKKITKNPENYSTNEDWLFWQDVFHLSSNDKKIYLSDFSHEGTFNLIDEKYRANTINEIVNQIENFINSLK